MSFLYLLWFVQSWAKQRLFLESKSALGTFIYDNEKKTIESFCQQYNISTPSILTTSTFKPRLIKGEIVRLLRLIRLFKKSNSFLVTCRKLEFLSAFFYLESLENFDFKFTISTTDVNPNGLAVLSWAKKYDVKTIFLNHGHIVPPLPQLDYSCAIIKSESALDVYGVDKEAFYDGQLPNIATYKGEGQNPPCIPQRIKSVGFLTSTFPYAERAIELAELLKSYNMQIQVVRLHPNKLAITKEDEKEFFAHFGSQICTRETSFEDDISRCDLVFAGNTSAHLDALEYGVASIFDGSLDGSPDDMYQFKRKGLVPCLEDLSLQNIEDDLRGFYGRPEWKDRAHYFGLYSDIDTSDVQSKVERLLKEQ